MDINDLRSMSTVLAFLVFVGIVAWAWSGRRKEAFDQAAQLALEDDSTPFVPSAQVSQKERK